MDPSPPNDDSRSYRIDWNVYFARGHAFDLAEGNILYRKLIHENGILYKTAVNNVEKRDIVTDVISRVHSKGGLLIHIMILT